MSVVLYLVYSDGIYPATPGALPSGNLGVALLREVFLPAIVPALPMALVIYCLREVFRPESLVAIGLIGLVGLLIYLLGYLCFAASEGERRFFSGLAQDWLRTVRPRF